MVTEREGQAEHRAPFSTTRNGQLKWANGRKKCQMNTVRRCYAYVDRICRIYPKGRSSFLGLLALRTHGSLALLGLLCLQFRLSRLLLGFSGFFLGLE